MPNGHVVLHVIAMVIIALLLNKLSDIPTLGNTDPTLQQSESEATTDGTDVHVVQAKYDKVIHRIGDDIIDGLTSPPVKQQEPVSSSVWCSDLGMCRFSNLCYNSAADQFVMFRNDNSVFENVKFVDGSLTIDLSSVQAHNVYQTTVATLPTDASGQFHVKWVHRKTLVFKRFLAGNLMHVFHDDLFPLHHSLNLIKFGDERDVWEPYNIQLFLFENDTTYTTVAADGTDDEHGHAEDQELDDIDKLYAMFTKWDIKYKLYFQYTEGLTCFKDVYVGLSRTTTWYEFGFTQQQGPIDNHAVSSREIRNTVQYISHRIGTDQPKWTIGDYLILLTRKENRKILNEMELTLAIVGRVKMKVLNLDYESHSLNDLITLVGNSRGILGMHGSLLILSAFLKKGSILLELFPYAVNPDRYTPYKTLANLKRMGIVYKAWSNQNAAKSFGHPDWPANLGGLMDIEEDQRELIIQQTDVPPHLCCSDPSWLYHIYQDTEVDTEQIVSLVDSSLKESTNLLSELNFDFHPSKVLGVTCNTKRPDTDDGLATLTLMWDVPWTVAVTINKHTNIMYEILVQTVSDESNSVIEKHAELTTLVATVDSADRYVVWVRCVLDIPHNAGPYSDACSCS